MTIPTRKPGTMESVGAYVLRRIIDAGQPVASHELHIGRPDHISESSPSTTASHFYSMGVLSRTKMAPNGQRGIRYLYSIADLDKLPPSFEWDFRAGASHHGPRDVRKRKKPSEILNRADNDPEEPMTETATLPEQTHSTSLADRMAVRVEEQHAKTYTELMLVFPTPKGLKRMTVAEAKELYRQLHEVFG